MNTSTFSIPDGLSAGVPSSVVGRIVPGWDLGDVFLSSKAFQAIKNRRISIEACMAKHFLRYHHHKKTLYNGAKIPQGLSVTYPTKSIGPIIFSTSGDESRTEVYLLGETLEAFEHIFR